MKKILIIVMALSSLVVKGQSSNNELFIKEIRSKYSMGDTISFVVHNTSNSKIFVCVGVEICLNNEWIEVTNDIHKDSFTKNRSVYSLKENSTLKQMWIPLRTPFIDLPSNSSSSLKGKFRLYIEYGEAPNSLKTKVYSNEFNLK